MKRSPRLLIDSQKILQNYHSMKSIFKTFKIYYAMKANSNPKIIQLLEKVGSSFEIASWEEALQLFKIKISPQRIIFSNPVKSLLAIKKAIKVGIKKFVFDSVGELDKFKKIGITRDIQMFLRISVSNIDSVWNLNEKFGLPEEQWEEIYQKMAKENIPLSGITFHVGSQCESLTAWEKALTLARRSIQMSHNYALEPFAINIGGGFPIKYNRIVPNLQDIYNKINQHLQIWKKKKLGIHEFLTEPGRYLVGSSGVLETTIIGISQKRDKCWVHLDSGFFSGMMETIHGSIQYPTLSTRKAQLQKVHLCGPTCDGLDILYEVEIPKPKVGDQLYFKNTGAYTNVYSTHFNGFCPPKVEVI